MNITSHLESIDMILVRLVIEVVKLMNDFVVHNNAWNWNRAKLHWITLTIKPEHSSPLRV